MPLSPGDGGIGTQPHGAERLKPSWGEQVRLNLKGSLIPDCSGRGF